MIKSPYSTDPASVMLFYRVLPPRFKIPVPHDQYRSFQDHFCGYLGNLDNLVTELNCPRDQAVPGFQQFFYIKKNFTIMNLCSACNTGAVVDRYGQVVHTSILILQKKIQPWTSWIDHMCKKKIPRLHHHLCHHPATIGRQLARKWVQVL